MESCEKEMESCFTLQKLERFLEQDRESSRGEEKNDPLDGFGFHPTDPELITILKYKRSNPDETLPSPIFETKIYDYAPSQLPGLPVIQTGRKWWNFFCEPILHHASGSGGRRFNRSAGNGYWKATGKPAKIKAKQEEIGEKRTLVFHERYRDSDGRSKEKGTNWVMREYSVDDNPLFKKNIVICRIKLKKDKTRRVSTKKENKGVERPLVSNNNEGRSKRRISIKNDKKPAKKHRAVVDNGDDVAEKSPLESQLLPNCHLIPTSVSQDIAETISPPPQLQPSCNLISNSRSDAVENAFPSVSNSNNLAIEDTSQVDPYPSVSNSDQHDIEDTSQAEPLPVENPNALNASTGMDQTSNSTLQPPILPEQGSSDYNVSINENDLWNSLGSELDSFSLGSELGSFPLGSELGSLLQSAFGSPDEFLPPFLGEETGHGTCSSFVTPTY